MTAPMKVCWLVYVGKVRLFCVPELLLGIKSNIFHIRPFLLDSCGCHSSERGQSIWSTALNDDCACLWIVYHGKCLIEEANVHWASNIMERGCTHLFLSISRGTQFLHTNFLGRLLDLSPVSARQVSTCGPLYQYFVLSWLGGQQCGPWTLAYSWPGIRSDISLVERRCLGCCAVPLAVINISLRKKQLCVIFRCHKSQLCYIKSILIFKVLAQAIKLSSFLKHVLNSWNWKWCTFNSFIQLLWFHHRL